MTLKIKGFRPMPGRVIVEAVKEAEQVGSIIVVRSAVREYTQGIVRYIPEPATVDGEFTSSVLAVGDVVVFGRHSGLTLTEEGGTPLIALREVDIVTVVEYDENSDPLEAPLVESSDVVGEQPFPSEL